MKKTALALLLLLPIAGCAHQQSAYGGGGGGYFADDCLYSYGCYDGSDRSAYFYGYGVSQPRSPARIRVTKVERRTSTRVVTRSAAAPRALRSSASVRGSSLAGGAHSAPAASVSHSGGRR
jgi:hypothetical protein